MALFRKDLRLVFRNRTLLVTLVLYPLILVSILGLVFANPKQSVPIAVVVSPIGNCGVSDHDLVCADPDIDTPFSITDVTEQISNVTTLTLFTPRDAAGFERDREAAKRLLLTGDVDAVIVFPAHFLRDLVELTQQGHIEIFLDESDLAKSTVAQNVVRGAIQGFNEEVVATKVGIVVKELATALGKKADLAGQDSFHGLLATLRRVKENPELTENELRLLDDAIAFVEAAIVTLSDAENIVNSIALPVQADISHVSSGSLFARDIIVPATVALSIFWTGILASSSLTVYERQSNAQLRLNVSPIGTGSVLASKLIVTVLIILAQSLFIVAVAKLAWDVRLDNVPLLVLMVGAGSFAAVGAGLLVAGVSRDTNGSTLLSVLAVFPMMFLSGLFFPISFMPDAAQALAHLVPLTYAVDGLRGAMLKGFTLGDAQIDLFFLAAFGAIAFAVGFVLNRRRARGA